MLVSAIMPTRGRPEMAARAVEYFDAQTWPEKELVILDDPGMPSFLNGIDRADIQYYRISGQVGSKRNICCARARGEVIIHWDDDDISSPDRMADQVERLISSGKSVTGYSAMRFAGSDVWEYRGGPECTLGTSLCYRRDWWRAHPFPTLQVGEDGEFVGSALRMGQLTAVDAGDLMTASIHPGNTSPRQLSGSNWRRLDA